MLKITAISDNHGNLNNYLSSADLLVIGGDLEPDGSPLSQAQWYDGKFRKWLNKIKGGFGRIIMHFGNHSFGGQALHFKYEGGDKVKEVLDSLPLEYYTVGNTEFNGYKIHINSFCMQVGFWAFGASEDDYQRWFENLQADILLCHGPPYGMLDAAYRYIGDQITHEHTGSRELASWVMRERPKLVITNHIHESFGQMKIKHYCGKQTEIVNVAQCDRGNNFKDRPVEIFLTRSSP